MKQPGVVDLSSKILDQNGGIWKTTFVLSRSLLTGAEIFFCRRLLLNNLLELYSYSRKYLEIDNCLCVKIRKLGGGGGEEEEISNYDLMTVFLYKFLHAPPNVTSSPSFDYITLSFTNHNCLIFSFAFSFSILFLLFLISATLLVLFC
jgi:hypothetical protein